MRWDERRSVIRATYGEAIMIALVLCALAVLAIAQRAGAQTPQPQPLPVTNITAPPVSWEMGRDAKIKGLIISRNGEDMTIRDENGYFNTVTLTADTKIVQPSGLFHMDKKGRDVTNLLPGLIVEVKGTGGDRGNLVASKVSFHGSALKVAEQIAAGTVALDNRVSANTDSINALKENTKATFDTVKSRIAEAEQKARDSLAAINVRFDDIDRYEEKETSTVLFATGSSMLTKQAKAALDGVASSGMAIQGYLVEVTGYTDDTGGEMMNQNLSQRRAQAVVNYLVQNAKVPIFRILNPTGFGESHPAASNSTSAGRTQNRRAEVRILVNKAAQK